MPLREGLGYLDPDTVDLEVWRRREEEGIVVVIEYVNE